jgi:hypothetical protein
VLYLLMALNYVKDTHINQNDYGLEELERGDGPDDLDDLDDDDDLLGNIIGCRARRRVGRCSRCDDDDAGENDDDDDDAGENDDDDDDAGENDDDDGVNRRRRRLDDDDDDDDDGVNRRRRRLDDDDDDDDDHDDDADTLGGRIIGSRDGGSSHGSNDDDDDDDHDGVNRRHAATDDDDDDDVNRRHAAADDDDDDDRDGVNRWRVAGGLYRVAADDDDDDHNGVNRWRVAGGLYRVACGLYRVACSGAPIGPLRIVGPPFNKTQLSTSRGARRPGPRGGGAIVGTTRALGNRLTLLMTALGNFLVFPLILPSLLDDHLALGDIFTTTSLRRPGPRGGGAIVGTTRALGNRLTLLMTALGNFLVFPLILPSLLDDRLALGDIFTTTSLRRLGPRGGGGIGGTTRAFGNIQALLMAALGNFLVFPLTLPSLLDDHLALGDIFTTTSLRGLNNNLAVFGASIRSSKLVNFLPTCSGECRTSSTKTLGCIPSSRPSPSPSNNASVFGRLTLSELTDIIYYMVI